VSPNGRSLMRRTVADSKTLVGCAELLLCGLASSSVALKSSRRPQPINNITTGRQHAAREARREERRCSQHEAAEACDMAMAQFGRLERGEADVRFVDRGSSCTRS
jgi:hypothetical protein